MPLSGKANKPHYQDIAQEKKSCHRNMKIGKMVLTERDCVGQNYLGLIRIDTKKVFYPIT